jgi:hypothetical protein
MIPQSHKEAFEVGARVSLKDKPSREFTVREITGAQATCVNDDGQVFHFTIDRLQAVEPSPE